MRKISIILLMVILSAGLSGCLGLNGQDGSQLTASGAISANEVNIAPQIGGQVVSVSSSEGDPVKKGDELFRLDDTLLKAQRDQTAAAVDLAQKALETAKIQYDLALNGARLQEMQSRKSAWSVSQPNQFDLPVWYFDKEEKIASANAEVEAAKADLTTEKGNLQQLLTNDTSKDFLDAEKRVAKAQAAFSIADQVLKQANKAQDREDLQKFAQDQYDAAETELNSAQTDYNRLLTTQQARDILEARARVRVAQERYDQAVDYVNSLLSGDQSLQVKAADSAVKQAEAALAQAQAALALVDVQLARTVITAPADGIILTQNLQPGETLSPGGVVLTLGQLQEVNLIVYIPETEYGKVKLGDPVSIAVDSFPGKTYQGTVTHISDQAEFTPKNVQTIEGRRTTVYAVKITASNPNFDLKPGMPADVTFGAK